MKRKRDAGEEPSSLVSVSIVLPSGAEVVRTETGLDSPVSELLQRVRVPRGGTCRVLVTADGRLLHDKDLGLEGSQAGFVLADSRPDPVPRTL